MIVELDVEARGRSDNAEIVGLAALVAVAAPATSQLLATNRCLPADRMPDTLFQPDFETRDNFEVAW